jgi:hypothetical protein
LCLHRIRIRGEARRGEEHCIMYGRIGWQLSCVMTGWKLPCSHDEMTDDDTSIPRIDHVPSRPVPWRSLDPASLNLRLKSISTQLEVLQ